MLHLACNESILMKSEAWKDRVDQSTFCFLIPLVLQILRDGILGDDEHATNMIWRVTIALFEQEFKYTDDEDAVIQEANTFIQLCDSRKIIMGTPILTNAGRHIDAPLSACSVLPVDFERTPEMALMYMHAYHKRSIGLGIPLDRYEHPLEIALKINEEVLKASKRGEHERRIGNMGTITVYHPRLFDLITAKSNPKFRDYEWRFNFSVDCDKAFMEAVKNDTNITRTDGTVVSAREIMNLISTEASKTGDPGLIFLDRLNDQNPTPGVGKVVSTAPCAEVGLIEGEACQFGYINLGEFVNVNGSIDLEEITKTVFLLTKALDNALEISIANLEHPAASNVMQSKRKIGIGICGLADMFAKLELPYTSQEARDLSRDLFALINYLSKCASVELAKVRGSALAMQRFTDGENNRHYASSPIMQKYARDTRFVTKHQWQELIKNINDTGSLRNVSTTALPPTGRSSLIIGASNGIEPWFTVLDNEGHVHPILRQKLEQIGLWDTTIETEILYRGTIGEILRIPQTIKDVFRTATEIPPQDHLSMTAILQGYNDESISKTVNMPQGTSIDEVCEIFMDAYDAGLCGITIYIDNSRENQPKRLAK
jgi:ribonucleoside-diphosphate reductase alpha chain